MPASPHYFLAEKPGAIVINNVASIIAGTTAGLISGASLTSLTAFQPMGVEAAIQKHGISLKKIIVEEFRAAVADSPRFDLVANRSNEQAQFQLEVMKYGLVKTMGFHMQMRPVIQLKASLVDSTGKRLWLHYARVDSGTKALPLHHFDDWQEQPGLLRDGYRKAARAVAAALLAEFKQ